MDLMKTHPVQVALVQRWEIQMMRLVEGMYVYVHMYMYIHAYLNVCIADIIFRRPRVYLGGGGGGGAGPPPRSAPPLGFTCQFVPLFLINFGLFSIELTIELYSTCTYVHH